MSRYRLDFTALGKRYSSGATIPKDLWNTSTNVTFVFARDGLPLEFLEAPSEPGAFARLLDEHGVPAA